MINIIYYLYKTSKCALYFGLNTKQNVFGLEPKILEFFNSIVWFFGV